MKVHIESKYCNEEVILRFGFYANGSTSIQAFSPEGEPVFKATVSLDEKPAKGCVFLKSWSENEGVPEALVKAGVVKLTGKKIKTGYCEACEAIEAELLCE